MSGQLFSEVRYTLETLTNYIAMGEIGLPNIQRPFVWKNVKVRDLFDSMYRGYPIGYILLWQNGQDPNTRTIGAEDKPKAARLLIVDGQQRLTAVYSILKGIPIIKADYSVGQLEIGFNPIKRTFAVSDAAVRRDKSYISDISKLWSDETDLFDFVESYIERLEENGEIASEQKSVIRKSIQQLHALKSYPLTALELTSDMDEEQVAEVFVRINSKGTPLNKADFILTLMSVFWDKGRFQLEEFYRASREPTRGIASSFNHHIEPRPDQLLRVAVALAFRRARLKYVYSILRGKDLETELFSEEKREEQFEKLKVAQLAVLDLKHWHEFIRVISQAGYLGGRMISSESGLIYTYAMYLIGRIDYKIKPKPLAHVISRWFFMISLTGRFTDSPESRMEFELAKLREIETGEEFLASLIRDCEQTLTDDFWDISLPNRLAVASFTNPNLFGYYAALILLDARALFSTRKVADLMDPSIHSTRSAFERHHLFPKAYLATQGFTTTRETNQIANYAILEWSDNTSISDQPPNQYVPVMLENVSAAERVKMAEWHALPDGWENMDYKYFLERRRELIAGIIRLGYTELCNHLSWSDAVNALPSIDDIIATGESGEVEFKSTLRKNLHTGQNDPRIENSALKTVAGFLNAKGGTLLIGVADDGAILGIREDGFSSEDKMYLHLINILKSRLGTTHMMYIHPQFQSHEDHRILAIDCWPSKSPVFLKDGNRERFFVRTGAATSELSPSETIDYVEKRF